MRYRVQLLALIVAVMVVPAFGDDDYVLYQRTGAAISGFVPSTSSAWTEFKTRLDLDLIEQLAYRDAQLAWLRAELNQAEPTPNQQLSNHIAIVERLTKQLDKESVERFRAWVQDPSTVKLSSNHWKMPVTAEQKYLLVEFRKTLLGWSAI